VRHVHSRYFSKSRSQSGYAFLLVVFFTTLLLVSTMAIAPSILTNGRREKEEEMIWRGKQYVRGVKLYYRKMGRFPTSLDDLTKPQVGSLRFMRQAYKDPMNKEDGSWRFIYVGPSGQLIGSLKPQQNNLQLPGAPQGMGTPASALGSLNGQQGIGGNGFGTAAAPGATQQTQQPGGASGTTTTTGTTSTDQSNGTANGQNDPMANPPADTGLSSTIIGGNIIGVGSKVNERSLRVYEKAKNYKLFEFIWDPSKDAVAGGQPGMQTGNGLGGTPIGQPIANPSTNPGGGGFNPNGAGPATTNPQQLQPQAPTPSPQ
jgi:hypothetical protein